MEHLLVVWCAEVSSDGLMKNAADPVFFNSIRGSPRRLVPGDGPREPREPREQPLKVDGRPVSPSVPPATSAEPSNPRRVHIRNAVGLARYGYTPGCVGCEAAMTLGPSGDSHGTVPITNGSKSHVF